MTLDDSNPVLYIRVPPTTSQLITTSSGSSSSSSSSGQTRGAHSISGIGRGEFSAGCPSVFRTRPGQRIAFTLYSFRSAAPGHLVGAPPVVQPEVARTADGHVVVAPTVKPEVTRSSGLGHMMGVFPEVIWSGLAHVVGDPFSVVQSEVARSGGLNHVAGAPPVVAPEVV